jgi:type IX secretion system PorP/SprF family membrane protein
MKRSVHIIFALAFMLQTVVSAQQTPITSQYLTNGLVINPAYAGTRGALSANLSYRKQWARIVGAPQFQNLSLHSPINKKEKVAGLVAEYNTYGVTKDVGIYGFYAYNIRPAVASSQWGQREVSISPTQIIITLFPDGNPTDPLLTGNTNYILSKFWRGVLLLY